MSQDLRKQSNVLEKILVAKLEYFILIQVQLGHVYNIPTMQFFHCNFQRHSVKTLYAIID